MQDDMGLIFTNADLEVLNMVAWSYLKLQYYVVINIHPWKPPSAWEGKGCPPAVGYRGLITNPRISMHLSSTRTF